MRSRWPRWPLWPALPPAGGGAPTAGKAHTGGSSSSRYIYASVALVVGLAAVGLQLYSSSPTPPEPPGVGLNAATYFVAPSAVDEFVQLEDVTPEAVLTAMKVRKYFTGELTAPVACYPAFPGPESAYLRAQIARIAQATAVKPVGSLMIEESEEALQAAVLEERLDAESNVEEFLCRNVSKACDESVDFSEEEPKDNDFYDDEEKESKRVEPPKKKERRLKAKKAAKQEL